MPEGLRVLEPGSRFPLLAPAEVGLHYAQHTMTDASRRLVDHITSSIQADGSVTPDAGTGINIQ